MTRASSARVATAMNSVTALKKTVTPIGAISPTLAPARNGSQYERYGAAVERTLKAFMDQGKSALFGALGIGGCYDAYTELRR